jgi:ABC-2 type transport system permease protein
VSELFAAEFVRHWHLYRRYPGDVFGGLAMMTMAFLGILAGGIYIAGPALGSDGATRIDGLIVGYVLWAMVMFILGDGAGNIQREAVAGTLEQVYLSPFGAVRIIVTRSLAGLTLHVALMFVLLGVILLLTGRRLDLSVWLLPPFVTVVFSALGLSLALGAAALVFKRVDQLLNLSRFFVLIPLVLPFDMPSTAARVFASLLPMAPGSMLLRSIAVGGAAVDPLLMGLAVLNGAAYFVAGLLVFNAADRYARSRALIGQH